MRLTLTVLCAVSLLLPPVGAAADPDDPEQELEDVQERLDRTREGIEEIDQERGLTLQDIERMDQEIRLLDESLVELQAELSESEVALSDAEQRLADTTTKLFATEDRLARTQDHLDGEQAVFNERTRASFMYGGPAQMATSMFDVTDVTNFGRALTYVQRVMASDRDRVTRVAGYVREIEADTAELEILKDQEAAARDDAAQERNRVAGLVEEERELRTQVAAQREERQVALNELDQDKEAHIELADALEEESEKLEEELRRRAEEERRRQEEERRRQEAEEQRQREEEEERRREVAQRSQRSSAGSTSSSGGGSSGGGSSGGGSSGGGSSGGGSSGGGSSGGGSSGGGGSSSPPQAPSSSQLQRPADGPVTSGYGYRTHPIYGTRRLHSGIDFGGGMGAPIYAANDGVVVSASARGGYGMTIIIDHGGGMTTLYAHQSRFAVSGGQRVSRGQVIGYIGSTGVSTGPHLHFEVRINGSPRNPADYL